MTSRRVIAELRENAPARYGALSLARVAVRGSPKDRSVLLRLLMFPHEPNRPAHLVQQDSVTGRIQIGVDDLQGWPGFLGS